MWQLIEGGFFIRPYYAFFVVLESTNFAVGAVVALIKNSCYTPPPNLGLTDLRTSPSWARV